MVRKLQQQGSDQGIWVLCPVSLVTGGLVGVILSAYEL